MKTDRLNVLIIGANGFIGSHLVDGLAARGYNVRALDKYTVKPKFKAAKNIDVIKGNSFNKDVLAKALKDIDYVFHAISATTPFTSEDDPYTDIHKNLVHNVQIFEHAQKAGVSKVMFISSGGAVYGKLSEKRPAREEDAPRPISPYGINKLATEYYLEYFKRKRGLDYIIYRMTNPYGPRQVTTKQQGVIPAFLDKITRGESLVVYGDGNATRDYVYIDDAVQMILDSFNAKTKHSIYNLASGRQTSVSAIIKTIEKVVGKKASVQFVEAPKTFLYKAKTSNKRFVDEFGKSRMTTLEKGIKKMLGDRSSKQSDR